MDELNEFERAVLNALLSGDGSTLKVLREQARVARLVSRESTGVGIFLNFEVPTSAPSLSERDFAFGDVFAEIEGLRHGAGFVLFVTDGRLSMLEGYSYAEPWPASVTNFKLSHAKNLRSPG